MPSKCSYSRYHFQFFSLDGVYPQALPRGPFLEIPEKPLVKLRPAYSVKLVFSYVVKGITIKITAKFRASKRLRFEDTNRISRPEMRPKSFGTFEKQAPGLRRNRPLNFEIFMSYKLDGCSKWICSHFQDEGETTRAKEITLEAMSFAASEVDGSGTVDRSSSAAERLKQNTDETSRTVQDGGDDKQVFLTDSLKALWFKMSAS